MKHPLVEGEERSVLKNEEEKFLHEKSFEIKMLGR
jgi:hypothetical protein